MSFVDECRFTGNIAEIGPALMALNSMNFRLRNNTYNQNLAQTGGDIATRPTHIQLVIYEVKEVFRYLDHVPFTYMLMHPDTVYSSIL